MGKNIKKCFGQMTSSAQVITFRTMQCIGDVEYIYGYIS
jgi:hypothetical protein